MRRPHTLLSGVVAVLIGTAAAAQQRPIFDPDDFVDPHQRQRHLFVSRLVAGFAWNAIDDYRPLGQDAGFLHITNSIYWDRFQFDYKHSEVRGVDDNGPAERTLCGCSNEPVYFPTPPPDTATPEPPLPGSKETVQFAWYRQVKSRSAGPPLMLRYRLTWSHQGIEENIRSAATGELLERRSGREQSFGLDADTHVRIRGRDLWGSLQYARTTRTGTTDDRSQHELTYMHRFPAVAFQKVLVRATLTAGGVSNRGGTALNVVNPAFEAFWHDPKTRANFHLIWSPQTTRDGETGWATRHQIAFFIDRALYVKLFR